MTKDDVAAPVCAQTEDDLPVYKTMSFEQVCYLAREDREVGFEECLNAVAADGWDLVTSFPSHGYSRGATTMFVFQRRAAEPVATGDSVDARLAAAAPAETLAREDLTRDLIRECRRLREALGEIASLAGSTSIDFGGSHDEQRAAIFNACSHAMQGKTIQADDYRSK